jgi:hypothetical protein
MPDRYDRIWSTAENQMIEELWRAGYSQGQIALKFHVTRNQIAGKIHRLNLRWIRPKVPKPPKEFKPPILRPETRMARLTALKIPKVEKAIPRPKRTGPDVSSPLAVSIAMPLPTPASVGALRADQCRWPMAGEYCSGKKLDDFSYCEEHARVAFRIR